MLIHNTAATAAAASGASQPNVDGRHHLCGDSGGVILAIAASSA
jgi:hypothetical protein